MKIKKALLSLVVILLVFTLVSCEFNSYMAVGLVRVTKNNFCETSFVRLDGKLVFSPQFNKRSEGEIHYIASLEEGELNVYYETAGAGVKELLFNIKAGENIEGRGGYIEKGKQKIIIETVSPAKGKITLNFV